MEIIMLFFIPLAAIFLSFPVFIAVVICYRTMVLKVSNNHDLAQREKAFWITSVIVALPIAAPAYFFATRPTKSSSETSVRTAPYLFAKQ